MDSESRTSFPAVFILLFLMASFGVIATGHIISNKPLLLVNYVDHPGLDYIDYFRASANILNHISPYKIIHSRYVTTPIPALLNTLFVPFGFERARNMMFVLVALSVAVAIYLAASCFPFSKADRNRIFLSGFLSLFFSYPFCFLLNRINIDGWVLLFLCTGLFLAQKPRKEWLSGLFLSLAIFFKIYPILILLPLLLYRRWRVLLWCGVWSVIWAIASSFWIVDFGNSLLDRSQSLLRLDENGSLYATVVLMWVSLGIVGIPTKINLMLVSLVPFTAAILYAVLISIALYADYRSGKDHKGELTDYILYVPFMLALPQTVYHYAFVVLLLLVPTICFLWQKNPKQSKTFFVMTIGLCLTQWQAVASFFLTQNVFAHAIPGLGLVLLMVCITIYKHGLWRQIQPPISSAIENE